MVKSTKEPSFIYKIISTAISCCCCKIPNFNMLSETWNLYKKIPTSIEMVKFSSAIIVSLLETKEMLFHKTHYAIDVIYGMIPTLSETKEIFLIKPYKSISTFLEVKKFIGSTIELITTTSKNLISNLNQVSQATKALELLAKNISNIEEKLQKLSSILEDKNSQNHYHHKIRLDEVYKLPAAQDIILEISDVIGDEAMSSKVA
jgi:hypothetical protein